MSQYQLLPNLTTDEYEALKADIAKRGVQVPIEQDAEGNILDGHHRMRACAELGLTDYPVTVRTWQTEAEKIEHVLALNLDRRHLTGEQRAELTARLRGQGWPIRKIAERLGVGVATVSRDISTVPSGTVVAPERIVGADGKSRPSSRPTTVVTKTPREAEKVLRGLQSVGDEAVPSGMVDARTVAAAVKQAVRSTAVEELREREAEVPDGTFDVIACDPPWQYDSRAADGTHRAANPYPTMSSDEIAAMSIPAADDCIMWLWTTNAFLHDAYHILDAWGFTPKTMLTWVKDRMGLGDWLRGKTEHCIMAVKGRPVVDLTNETTALTAPMREHSRKPDEFYAMVEKLCHGRKLEMFAREQRGGWYSFGNEIDKFQG